MTKRTETVLEAFVYSSFNHLTRLLAQEYSLLTYFVVNVYRTFKFREGNVYSDYLMTEVRHMTLAAGEGLPFCFVKEQQCVAAAGSHCAVRLIVPVFN
jgi:hypothetical protein